MRKPVELFRAHALAGMGTPVNTYGPHESPVHLAAVTAHGFSLVRPEFNGLSASPALYFFGKGLPDLLASRATFLEHAHE